MGENYRRVSRVEGKTGTGFLAAETINMSEKEIIQRESTVLVEDNRDKIVLERISIETHLHSKFVKYIGYIKLVFTIHYSKDVYS
jgi:hypothetical protein